MYAFALNAFVLTALTGASPDQAVPSVGTTEVSGSSDLMGAFRASDVAEIYIVRRSLTFPFRARPDMVRMFGCKYRLHRETPEWRELERALVAADVRIVPTAEVGEVRIGLVLGDWRGTVWEAYSRRPHGTDTEVTGFNQRRQVVLSASFANALESFVERHRDLALVDRGRPELCEGEAPT